MLRSVFRQARLAAPSIVFLDEIDALFGSRAAADEADASSMQLLGCLLTEMDGLELARGACSLLLRHGVCVCLLCFIQPIRGPLQVGTSLLISFPQQAFLPWS